MIRKIIFLILVCFVVVGMTSASPVKNKKIIPFPGEKHKPADLDKDGLYEDINGDKVLNAYDTDVFFRNVEWARTNEPVSPFDFYQSGNIGFADAVALYRMVM